MSEQTAASTWTDPLLPAPAVQPQRFALHRDGALQVLLRVTDLGMLVLAGTLAAALLGAASDDVLIAGPALVAVHGLAFWLVAECRGLYRDPTRQARDLPVARIGGAWLQACGVVALAPLLLGAPIVPPPPGEPLPHLLWPLLPLFLLLAPLLMVLGRAVVLGGWARAGLLPSERTPVLIYGVGTAARELAQVLTQDPGARMSVRGFVNPAGAGSTPATLLGKPVLARHEHLAATTGPSGAQTVLMPLALFDTAGIEAATRQLAPFPVALKLVPNMAVRGIPLQFVDHSAPVPMLQICASQPSVLVRMVKRAEDLVLAPLLLLAAAPLLLLAAVAVRLDSPGPVLFRQARRGADGVVFQVYKFRTMYHMAADQHGKVQAVQGDARVTRVGAVLRRTSLDEMPQLLNVLLGSMSLVGPRPHALGSCAGGIPFEQAVAAYPARQRVRPGITGWAQVNGWRGETDTVDKLTGRVTHDLWYIANWSLGLDLMIMLRTVAAIMSGRNAY